MVNYAMDDAAREPNSYPASRLVGYMAFVIGLVWIALMVVAAIAWAVERTPNDESLFNLPLREIAVRIGTAVIRITPIALTGVVTAYFGFRLRRRVAVDTVRPAAASLSFMAVLTAGVTPIIFDGFAFQPGDVVRAGDEVWFFIVAAAVALPVYAVLCRQVLKHDGIRSSGFREIFTRPILMLAAFLTTWYAFFVIAATLGPHLPLADPALRAAPLVLATSIGLLIYMVAVYIVDRGWELPDDNASSNLQRFPASKIVARSAIAAGGLCIVVAIATPIVSILADSAAAGTPWYNRFYDRVVVFTITAPALITPGLYCLYHGKRLSRNITLEEVRQTVASLLIAALSITVLALLSGPSYAVPLREHTLLATVLGFAILAVFVYGIVSRKVLTYDGIPTRGLPDILTRRATFWMSMIAGWAAFYVVSRVLYFVAVVGGHFTSSSGMFLLVVIPILAGWLFYRVTTRALDHEPRQSNKSSKLQTHDGEGKFL